MELKYRQGVTTPGGAAAAPPPVEDAPLAGDVPPFDVDDALDRAEEDTL